MTERNPLLVAALFDPLDVAESIASFWRSGSRQHRLLKQVLDIYPAVPLATYNASAEIAWQQLFTAEERRLAFEEVNHGTS